ncbi:MAG: mechanosensitive ion channel family protein [Alphaproteobacteria bacterium]
MTAWLLARSRLPLNKAHHAAWRAVLARIIGIGLLFTVLPLPAGAQEIGAAAAEAPEASDTTAAVQRLADPRALRAMLAGLSDSELRSLMLARVDQLESGAAVGPVLSLEGILVGIQGYWSSIAAGAPALPSVVPFFLERIQADGSFSILLVRLMGIAGVLAVGWLVERLFRRTIAPAMARGRQARPAGGSTKAALLLLEVALEILSLIVFVAATLGLFLILHRGYEPVRLTFLYCLAAIVVIRLVSLFSRTALTPRASGLRIAPVSDRTARHLHRRVLQVTIVSVVGQTAANLLRGLGLETDVLRALVMLFNLIVVAMLIAMIFEARRPVADFIRGDLRGVAAPDDAVAATAIRARTAVADVWHILMIGYVLLLWLMATIMEMAGVQHLRGAGLASLFLIIAVPVVDQWVRRGVDRIIESRRHVDPDAEAYGDIVRRGLRLLLILVAGVLFAGFWGLHVFDLAAQGIGERAASALLSISATLLFAYVAWEIARITIDRRLAALTLAEDSQDFQRAARLRTLLPLSRKAILVVLAVMVVMIVLSSLGVNIGPLLAGAGVAGIAIGLGAQTLVKDIVSGVFFLLDDAFRIGEYIDVGDAKGRVETISMRSLRLRHHLGALYTVPYSEIRQITNNSRDWVIMRLEFPVPLDIDLLRVKKIFKEIGAELKADPEIGPNLLEPLKSQGVRQVNEGHLIIRGKFMAKPGEQFLIRREVYQRVQRAFAAHGLAFASPGLTVRQEAPTALTEAEDAVTSATAPTHVSRLSGRS